MALPFWRHSTSNSGRGGWLAGLMPAPGGLAYTGIVGPPSGLSSRSREVGFCQILLQKSAILRARQRP